MPLARCELIGIRFPSKKYRTKPGGKNRSKSCHYALAKLDESEPPIRLIITRVNIKSARGSVIASAKTDSLPREPKQAPPPCLLIHRARSLSMYIE
jgi:hypothetical protein